MNLVISSFRDSLPSSISFKIATAVNCFDIEAILKMSFDFNGVLFLISASPKADSNNIFPPFDTSIDAPGRESGKYVSESEKIFYFFFGVSC